MKKLFIAAIAAAAILPSAAMAQHYDRHDNKVVVVDHRGPAANKRIVVGTRIEPGFIARQEVIRQPARYRLARASANTRWLRVHDDAVLVNLRTGRVLNVAFNLFR